MSRQTGVDSQEVQQDKSADSGKALQNPRGSDCPWLASKAIGNLPYWLTSRECAADGLERLGFGWAKHGNSRNGISSNAGVLVPWQPPRYITFFEQERSGPEQGRG
jgi:hypothetical protein